MKTPLFFVVWIALTYISLSSSSLRVPQYCDVCGDPRASCFLRQADVVVLFESSNLTNAAIFDETKKLILNLFGTFAIDGQCGVRVALVVAEENPREVFSLSDNVNADDIFTLIDGEVQGSSSRVNIISALDYVRNVAFSEEQGGRPDVPHILAVITDNLPTELSGLGEESTALRDEGVIIIAAGVGEHVSRTQLNVLASNVNREFLFPDSTSITSSLNTLFQQTVCHDVNECENENGNCSDVCINTSGSYFCSCGGNLVLADDRRTCIDPAEDLTNVTNPVSCALNNGGCCQLCINTTKGRNCSCEKGFQLNDDGFSCSDVNECFVSSCSYICVNLVGSFYCECKEDEFLSDDSTTCVPRPGPADCPKDFFPVSHSCMTSTNGSLAYADAEGDCANKNNSRLAKVADGGTRALVSRFFPGKTWIGLTNINGVWTNSDGTPFTFRWAYGEPRIGNCAYVQNQIFSALCDNEQRGACEIPRIEGFAVFSNRWNSGRQGKIYLPTDVNKVIVEFPCSVSFFHVWYASISERLNARQYIVTQNNVERNSNDGHIGFILFFRSDAFPDYQIRILGPVTSHVSE